jgi:hypothetical protein
MQYSDPDRFPQYLEGSGKVSHGFLGAAFAFDQFHRSWSGAVDRAAI